MPHEESVFGENSFYRAPGGKWAQETWAGCPQQRYATGEPGKVQGLARVEIVEGFYEYPAFGEKLFYRETQSTRLGGRHMS